MKLKYRSPEICYFAFKYTEYFRNLLGAIDRWPRTIYFFRNINNWYSKYRILQRGIVPYTSRNITV
ncbi:MAG: hypothetical protein HC849_10120 [Oscillatoriales cyanobacterium RU_3_3]|nr:hypothetical protein [Oscillatoriales cyanobacterium RU_3_3]